MDKIAYFYAKGCEPCSKIDKNVIPRLEKMNIEVEKIPIFTRRGTGHAKKYKVHVSPTILYIKDGIIKDYSIGYPNLETEEENISFFLRKIKEV